MSEPAFERSVLRFGVFELDFKAGEVRQAGVPLDLPPQPFKILALLASRPGELVSREEIQEQVWGSETFVDFEQGLNTCIKKIRDALGDHAEVPRYIQTVPRRGYRFVAPVEPLAAVRTPPLKYRWTIAASAAAIVALMALLFTLNVAGLRDRLLRRQGPPKIESIAVLPLQNLSGDPEQEYFAEGMTDALITELGKASALRVISRTSAMHYKGTKKQLPEIARELNVDAIVEGTVQRSGDHIRITAQLLHARADRHLWAESYERDLPDVLALQGEMAQAIAREVRINLTPQEHTRLAHARSVDPQAYQLFLRGRYHWSRWPEGWDKAIEAFQQAADKDPTFAQAYAAFATLFAYQSLVKPREELYNKTHAAAMRAVELEPTLSEGRVALGLTRQHLEWDWAGAEREAKLAIELNPSNPEAHALYGMYLSYVGRQEAGIASARRAQQLDPFSMFVNLVVVKALMYAGRFDEAVAECNKILELDPGHAGARGHLAESYTMLGMYDAALGEWKRAGADCGAIPAYTYAASGSRRQARDCIREMEAQGKQHYLSPFWLAIPYVGLGENERAIELLNQAYQEHAGAMVLLKTLCYFRPLHSDPRFQDIVRRMNFPE